MKRISILFLLSLSVFILHSQKKDITPKSYSGIYPKLAYYNFEGECGTGAVVPWANRLWVITYGPHMPFGSSDKLYEITPELKEITRPESIGGTPANRMIHKESGQLFIGPYIIDSVRNIRVIPWKEMPGRLTGIARHLINPAEQIYYGTMEEGFYDVNVKTLKPTVLYEDGNVHRKPGEMPQENSLLPGSHGKGLYSGQGVMVFSNNGEATREALTKFDIESGVLAEWNGKDWKVIRRNQFVEVTGPGGIYGNKNPQTDAIWATGWDFKSLIVGVRDNGKWSFYRLPKASHSYDGAHGWNTEWPRIRDVGTAERPDYLMTMHGLFWKFPATFSSENSKGIRPLSAYLKVIGDFTRWNNQLVFGCDDAAQNEFLNGGKIKGGIAAPGQSNSNIWFTSLQKPNELGPNTSEGAVWISQNLKAGEVSEPFLFAGWDVRSSWFHNEGSKPVTFTYQIDERGNNTWKDFRAVTLQPSESAYLTFRPIDRGEWIRVIVNNDTKATVQFSYAQNEKRTTTSDSIFAELSTIDQSVSNAGLIWDLSNNRRKMGMLAGVVNDKGFTENGYYELDSLMNLVKKEDSSTATFIREKLAIPKHVVTIDEASVLIIDDKGRRWRLPKGDPKFTTLTDNGILRICREVSTERDLFNCSGTFYELPAENADGFAKIRPISSHNFRIYDYASYRGMLIMTGLDSKTGNGNLHIIRSNDGKAKLWAGTIDDLWKMGKPVGQGGPWKNSTVKANEPSDPYLIGFYDKRSLLLLHNSDKMVRFKLEVDPIGDGQWMEYRTLAVQAGETMNVEFPKNLLSRWIRIVPNIDCVSTATFIYR